MKEINNAYCTLFDSMYADKGIALMQSLRKHNKDSFLYVLCMDDLCYSILSNESFPNVVIVKLEEFLDEELILLKEKRSKGEFCWTCTGKLIKYVLDRFNAKYCTYIDSDLYFFSNPDILVNEMIDNNCSVQVVPHRFPEKRRWKIIEAQSGKNCVQFNTFTDEYNSRKLLEKWIGQCIKKCDKYSGGDQMYTSDWGQYTFVNVSANDGGGLAPWNIEKYRAVRNNNNQIIRKSDKKVFDLVFYHFQGLEYVNRYSVNIHVRNKITVVDQKLLDSLYIQYLTHVESIKNKLEEQYGVVPLYSHSTGLFGEEKNEMTIKKRVSKLLESRNIRKDTYDLRKIL